MGVRTAYAVICRSFFGVTCRSMAERWAELRLDSNVFSALPGTRTPMYRFSPYAHHIPWSPWSVTLKSTSTIWRTFMKAAVVKQPNTGLVIEDRPVPEPQADQVLIRVHACGVCHSDLGVLTGAFPFGTYPRIPGHEVAG